MSNVDNLYQDYLQKDRIARLAGTVAALEKQLTYTNSLLVRLVAQLSGHPTMSTFASADTVTRKSPTIQQRRVKGDWP